MQLKMREEKIKKTESHAKNDFLHKVQSLRNYIKYIRMDITNTKIELKSGKKENR
jgi:hypothetical protein